MKKLTNAWVSVIAAGSLLGCGAELPGAPESPDAYSPAFHLAKGTRVRDGAHLGPVSAQVSTPRQEAPLPEGERLPRPPSLFSTLPDELNSNTSSGGFLDNVNVSKVTTRSLLYGHSTTQLFAEVVLRLDGPGEVFAGYFSWQPDYVHRQVEDMLSRGLDGAVVRWQGATHPEQAFATRLLLHEAEASAGKFGIALRLDARDLSGEDPTAELVARVSEARPFLSSHAYLKLEQRGVLFLRGFERVTVDWNQVRQALSGLSIRLLHEGNTGFEVSAFDGAFAALSVDGDPRNWGEQNLIQFYLDGGRHGPLATVGVGYAGFNDFLRHPTTNVTIDRDCGQTWLRALNLPSRFYREGTQLAALQLVSWNDYEAGTAIENGVDNCVAVTSRLSMQTLEWDLSGSQDTLDHFEIFQSLDGLALTKLGEVPPEARSFDLAAAALPQGSYGLYVKAVGKPSIRNHLAAPVTFTVIQNRAR